MVATVDRTAVSEIKTSINLRIEGNARQIIDDAAAVLGKTRTDFMIDSARKEAIEVLLDQQFFGLGSDQFDTFVASLDNPPAPDSKLKSLMRRIPAWKK